MLCVPRKLLTPLIDAIDKSHHPLIRYAPAAWKDRTWPMFTDSILKDMDTDPLPTRQKFVQMELDMTLAMFKAGVPFMAGTDTAAGVHAFPGFSLHDRNPQRASPSLQLWG